MGWPAVAELQNVCHTKIAIKSWTYGARKIFGTDFVGFSTLELHIMMGTRRRPLGGRHCGWLQLDDVVRSNAKVVLRRDGAAAFATSALMLRRYGGLLHPPVPDPPIEDHLDVRIIVEALNEVTVQPRVIARDDEHVSHGDAILRRPLAHHVQNSSRSMASATPGRAKSPGIRAAARRAASVRKRIDVRCVDTPTFRRRCARSTVAELVSVSLTEPPAPI